MFLSPSRIGLPCLLFLLAGCLGDKERYSSAVDVARLEQMRHGRALAVTDLEKRIRSLEDRITRLKHERDQTRRAQRQLVLELEPMLATLENLRQDVAAAKAQVDKEKERRASLAAQLKKEQAATAKVQKGMAELTRRRQALEKDLPRLRQEITKLEKEGLPALQAARQRKAALEAEYQAALGKVQSEIEKLEKLLDQTRKARPDLFPQPKPQPKPNPKPPAPKK